MTPIRLTIQAEVDDRLGGMDLLDEVWRVLDRLPGMTVRTVSFAPTTTTQSNTGKGIVYTVGGI